MQNPIHSATSAMLIRKPVQEVFEAFIQPEITTKFWFTHSSGKLEKGVKGIWTWEMYHLKVPLEVKEIELNEKIVIEWGEGKQQSLVQFEFKVIQPKMTYLSITNYGFQESGDKLINQVIDSTGGFTLVIAGLKAWLEHGIQLNLIGDKFPKEMMD